MLKLQRCEVCEYKEVCPKRLDLLKRGTEEVDSDRFAESHAFPRPYQDVDDMVFGESGDDLIHSSK